MITIQQIEGTGTGTASTRYRMPAVMTEAQYNRCKSNTNTSTLVDTYYTKGTNGYNNSANSSDTTTKYILKYQYDPNSAVTANNTGFNGNTAIPNADILKFRDAEKIEINVNAAAVTLTNSTGGTTGTLDTLTIRLSGSSAPQVPGATYAVTLQANLVNDNLGNNSALETVNVDLRGVAKPFIRIRKSQDTISVDARAASLNYPKLEATQPFLAYARIDCRTPGSTINSATTGGQTFVNTNNDGLPGTAPSNTNKGNNNWRYDQANPDDYAANWFTNAGGTTAQARPGNPTTAYTNSTQITFGYTVGGTTSPTINNVQGFRWWARAIASKDATNSSETEEMAYRTVISYQLRNGNAAITTGNNTAYSILLAGDQIWIRGGDAIGSSSIPGFPFTWADDWDDLSGKRAGIRLMSLVSISGNMNNSLWRLVTWDMNATAYIDFIRGIDPGTGANYQNIAWQYGPVQYVYQRNGWTAYKEQYPIYAGKHRWCDTGYAQTDRGAINFSNTNSSRQPYTTNSGWTTDTLNRE
jgi:hypothetical protein